MTSSSCSQLLASTSPPRRWPISFWRGLIFCLLFSVIFLPEFTRNGTSNAWSPFYAKARAGFRFIDLAILILVLTHLVVFGCLRRRIPRLPKSLAIPGVAFLVCIAIAVAYGHSRGGSNFFFDWRSVALGMALYFVWSFWIRNTLDLQAAIRLFAVYMAARIALLYLLYFTGYRDTLLGVSIPIFDGPAISCIVFTALLAFTFQASANGRRERLFWAVLAAAACLIVLLCFRRTYWGELGAGMAILLLLRRFQLRTYVLIGIAMCGAVQLLGGSLSSRIASLDVTDADSEFSAGNADHVLDLVDAWDQVKAAPLMGIGVGIAYPTSHLRGWKTESVMVHNAPLHVWLKYGLAGLVCYLWFHIALLTWLYRGARRQTGLPGNFLGVVFAYLGAQFVMTLGFAPWPYSELQLTTLISFLIAAAVACDPSRTTGLVL
jgi:hypothetical protein